MKVDYFIVGLGLAGLAFVEELIANDKSFIVFENASQTSSLVAGGVYNPVILKRFTPVWNASKQLEIALPFYSELEDKFNTNFDKKFLTKKVFNSIEDQNNWFGAIDKYNISKYLDDQLDHAKYQGIISQFGFGNVKQTGRVDTKELVKTYRLFLKKEKKIIFETFDYNQIKFSENIINYKTFSANRVVFSEGFGLKQNPFFNYLPLTGVKGETIIIYAPDVLIDFQIKSSVFVLPLGNNYFKIGATFNRLDKTSTPTKEGKQELIDKLSKVVDVPYKIIEHTAGVRPTVKDRRPLLGNHPIHKNLFVLNGLGTRGVMIAPTMAKQLYNYIENKEMLDEEVDIKRFI